MLKQINKLLGKIDFRGDWESKLDDPEPLTLKSLFLAILSFPLAIILLALGIIGIIALFWFLNKFCLFFW